MSSSTDISAETQSVMSRLPVVLHIDECFNIGTYKVIGNITANLRGQFNFVILYGNRCDKTLEVLRHDFPNVEMHRWPHSVRDISPVKDLRALLTATRLILQLKPDVIHCHSSKAGVLGRIASVLTANDARTVYTPHGVSFGQANHSKTRLRLFRWIEYALARSKGLVVACSSSELRVLRSAKIDAVLIANGVDCSSVVVKKAVTTKIKRTVVAVGRITAAKEPHRFDTLARRFSHRSDIEFVWIGDGELRDQLSSSNVRVLGWLDRKDLHSMMSEADIYCSTSSSEGLSLAALEAMALGLPLLMSDCVGNPDLVDGTNGFVFHDDDDAAKKLAILLDTAGLIASAGLRSREIVRKQFDVTRMVDQYAALYRRLSNSQL